MSHYVDEGFKAFNATAAIPAYSAVKLSGKNIVVAAAAADVIIGVIHAAVPAGGTIDVRLRSAAGTLNILAGGTIAQGDAVTSNASGQGITTVSAGNQIIGYALEAGTAGKIVELMPSTAKV
jgi:hypothetical protein